jgi:site-specific DNA recombinase
MLSSEQEPMKKQKTVATEPSVLYARVSSKEQAEEGFSIPAQRQLLRQYAQREGLQVVIEFSDDETAKSTGRTGFGAMLKFFTEHPEVRTLIVEKVDRLTRNFEDYGALKRLGLTIHFVKEGTILHPSAHSSVRLFTGMRVLMAEHYVENLSEEVKKGMHEKAAEGGWPTWAPLGYRNVRRPEGIEPDPEKAPIIVELFEAAATGAYSLRDLAKLARRRGLTGRRGKTVSKSNIAILLANPVYTGTFRWGGKTYEGKYDPLISRALFEEVQDALAGRTRPCKRKHTFTYTGLVTCEHCKGLLVGQTMKRKYTYYACNGKNGCRTYYPEATLDEHAMRVINSLAPDEAMSDFLLHQLGDWYDTITSAGSASTERLRKRITELQRLKAASYEEKLLGRIDERTWASHNERWQQELDELQVALASSAPTLSRSEFLRKAGEPIELAQTAARQYVTQTTTQKAELLRTLLSNCTMNDGSLSVTMRKPYDVLAKMKECTDWLGGRESNPDSLVQSQLSYH